MELVPVGVGWGYVDYPSPASRLVAGGTLSVSVLCGDEGAAAAVVGSALRG